MYVIAIAQTKIVVVVVVVVLYVPREREGRGRELEYKLTRIKAGINLYNNSDLSIATEQKFEMRASEKGGGASIRGEGRRLV